MIDDAKIAALKAEHGSVRVFSKEIDDEVFEAVFRRPTSAHYNRFMSDRDDEETKQRAFANLVYGCAVYPDAAGMKSMIDVAPGLVHSFGNLLLKWAGLGTAEHVKK